MHAWWPATHNSANWRLPALQLPNEQACRSDLHCAAQALAQAEATAAGADELADLAAEAELPLDQLLASYGYQRGAAAAQAEQPSPAAAPAPAVPGGARPQPEQGADEAMPVASSDEGGPSIAGPLLACVQCSP